MQVEAQLGMPVEEHRHPRAGLPLGQGEPVAVQVEQVVVAAARGPAVPVAHVLVVDDRHGAVPALPVGEETGAAVGILHGIDQEHAALEQRLRFGARVGGQVMEQGEGGVAAGGLVAVHAGADPEGEGAARVLARGHGAATGQEGLHVRDPARLPHHGHDQRTPLVALPVVSQDDPRRGRGDRREGIAQLGRGRGTAAQLVAEQLREIRNRRAGIDRHQGKNECEGEQDEQRARHGISLGWIRGDTSRRPREPASGGEGHAGASERVRERSEARWPSPERPHRSVT